MSFKTKKLTTLAMLTAMAFVVGALIRIRGFIPGAPFLTYDPKDVVIVIGGLIFGPLSAAGMSILLPLIEMITVSDSGFFGFLMNALASLFFTVPPALIYLKTRSLKGAVLGLIVGALLATSVMMLLNLIITPLYTGWPRERVMQIMFPAIMPFNLLKTFMNASLAMLIYKPVSAALMKTGLIPKRTTSQQSTGKFITWNLSVMIGSAVVLGIIILIIYLL